MLNDVDESLRSLIQAAIPNDGGPPLVSFDAPTAQWAAELSDPVINLFLYDIREDLQGQSSDEIDVRDGDGKLIGRLPPPRRYQLSYLASAWTKDAEAEHALLGAILATVPDEPGIPARHLAGRLAEQPLPVQIKVGMPLAGANTWDLWAALGTPPRSAVEIVVTAPLVPELRTDLAPPAVNLELGVSRKPPGAIGQDADQPAPARTGEEPPAGKAEPEPAKGARSRRKREEKEEEDPDTAGQVPELEARPGKRWTTFRVREEAVPAPSGD